MPSLVRCPTCHRHVFAGTEECPFCAREGTTTPLAPRLVVAAVAASAVMLASMGCAYGMPDTRVDAGDDAGADAKVANDASTGDSSIDDARPASDSAGD